VHIRLKEKEMRTKKLTVVLLVLLTLALAATGCGTPTAEPTATTAPAAEPTAEPTEAPAVGGVPDLGGREIRAVTTADLPPYNFLDENGDLTGWEIELVEKICELVNCELTWAISSFDGLIPGLAAGDYDVAASDLFIRPDRAEIVDFTPPYLVSGEVVVVRADDDRVQSYMDLEGLDDVLVGAEGGTSCEEAAREVANVPDERMRIYESIDVAFLALLNEDVDAIVDGSISSLAYVDIHAPALKIVGGGAEEALFTRGESALAVRQGEPELLEAFSVAVQTFVDDGTMDSLLDKWDVPRWGPID
jgi:polar amino acid transport system substrate-binding protein